MTPKQFSSLIKFMNLLIIIVGIVAIIQDGAILKNQYSMNQLRIIAISAAGVFLFIWINKAVQKNSKPVIQNNGSQPPIYTEPQDPQEKEFSFVWYKKIQVKECVFYVGPFKSVISAKTQKEAEECCKDRALENTKAQLCIAPESDYDIAALGKLRTEMDWVQRDADIIMTQFFKNH